MANMFTINSISLAITGVLARNRGAVTTADRVDTELKRRNLPCAEDLVRHRHKERERGQLLPFLARRDPETGNIRIANL